MAERLLTEFAIKSLLVRERYYRDTEQWTNLRNCYHPDAPKTYINISWFVELATCTYLCLRPTKKNACCRFQGNIDGFVAGSQKMAASRARPMHTISPVEVHLRGKRAVTESTGSILVRFKHEGVEYDCTSYTRFISRLEQVEGDWKILTLEAIYDRDTIQPVKPEGAAAKALVLDKARPSYQCLSWLLSQSGFKIDQTLPGVDIPGSGEELVSSCLSWLRGDVEEGRE